MHCLKLITFGWNLERTKSRNRNRITGDPDEIDLIKSIIIINKRESFITLKDHKENIKNKPTCRLINPCKPEIGKISKQLLEKIVKVVKDKTKYNHWKNTQDVITWFEDIPNKKSNTFIAFVICDFYPSITEELLDKALDFACHYIEITNDEREIIKHTKKDHSL